MIQLKCSVEARLFVTAVVRDSNIRNRSLLPDRTFHVDEHTDVT